MKPKTLNHRARHAALALAVTTLGVAIPGIAPVRAAAPDLRRDFVSPPDAAKPWVYWYFMDGNQTQAGMLADLEAMKKAGIGGMIVLDVDIGIPRGPVAFMSPQWQSDFAYAVKEAKRLGLEIALGSGPGWCGAGGPWITPADSMQHIVSSETHVTGGAPFDGVLPRPKPRTPFFGEGTLTESLKKQWQDYYKDEYVIAFPTPEGGERIFNVDDKALYYRSSYSSMGAAPRIPSPITGVTAPAEECIPAGKIIDLTGKMDAGGRLRWDAPAGNWTVMRLGRTATGQTTRPAPEAGLGFESDKFETSALDVQFHNFEDKLIAQLGPQPRIGNAGLTTLHFDSWEVSSQNWSTHFRQEFTKSKGYDPLPYLPAMMGYVVGTPELSERFLWDLRDVSSDLVVEKQGRYMADYAHKHGMQFSVEPYDLNPSADLDLGSVADLPMGEFWSRGYSLPAEFSVIEATSVGHTNGRKVIGAESFTADSNENWLQYPGSMKEQLDWAICAGLNKFVIHRYQHQPALDQYPGMTMGPYGVHWERTQTWWDMVPAFHTYITRSCDMLRQGLPVADILYLTPEGAPEVFTPPTSAFQSNNGYADRRGYNFDGCSPKNLIAHAKVKGGRIVFPDGMSYQVLVLPQWNSMTPGLLRKIVQLTEAGATVVGAPPLKSPSLVNYPASDTEIKTLAAKLWGAEPYAATRKVGLGRVVLDHAQSGLSMDKARWIWFDEGSPAQSAPPGKRYFHKTITLTGKVAAATAIVTADNRFDLTVNGHAVGHGDNFHETPIFDIAKFLKPGANVIKITATNDDEGPNPAGLIGAFQVTGADGAVQTFQTDSSWLASQSPLGDGTPAKDLGERGMGPWSISGPKAAIYQQYDVTAGILAGMKVAPDFESTVPMRYIHRKLADGDMYFIANGDAKAPVDAVCSFRTAGHTPEWWNPVTGETRNLGSSSDTAGVTSIPVHLAAGESGFVIFRKPAAPTVKLVAPLPPGANLPSEILRANFPTRRPVLTLKAPWTVAFDPKWGGPAQIQFTSLDDWSKRPEDGIKHYSGKATYTTTFNAPAAPSKTGTYSLSLGTVKNLASVKLNGRDLGVVWCAPWRVTVPAGALKAKGNQLKITVANLWSNRLIGDAGKPETQRFSHTTYTQYNANSPLQPSGLLGPVVLER
ncbi:MAG: hypothetical protein JWQ02_2717 [Capsulimonas sp.]|nr:hypothetical protein [Capsulimonas sp.]